MSSVVTLARLIRTEADKRARAHGMTRAQWTIILHLERHPGVVQKQLAELLEVEPITVARLVDRLEARGMVERRADPMDRRCWRLHLTDASRPLVSEVEALLDALAAMLTDGIVQDDLAVCAGALARMRENVAAEIRRAPPLPSQDDKIEGLA